jgi:PAS domain S-box-containing protein
MTAFLPNLLGSGKQSSQLRIPVMMLIVAIAIIGFGLLSSEEFFSQLDTSMSAVAVSSLLTEVESVNIELRDMEAFEHSYIQTSDTAAIKDYTRTHKSLDEHLSHLQNLRSSDSKLASAIDELVKKIRDRMLCAQIFVDRHSHTPAAVLNPLEVANESSLNKAATRSLTELITEQNGLRDNYAGAMQNASMTTLFLILTFRSAVAVLLVTCLLLVSRYFAERQAMETLLKGAETKFRAVFDQAFQFSGVLSPSGDLLDYNRTLPQFAQIDPNEVLGKSIWLLSWWEGSKQTQNDLQSAVAKAAEGTFTRFEGTFAGTASGPLVLDFSVKPVRDERNLVSMLILEATDITRHKVAEQRADERAARLNAIVETAPDGIVTLSPNGVIESVNDAMLGIFGYEATELTGKNIDILMPGFFADEKGRMQLEALKAGERKIFGSELETIAERKDGKQIPVELSLSILNLGDRQIVTGIVRDITERKQAQQRLKDFYSNVSHELRTPLTSIRTALGLIEEGVAGTVTEETAPIIQIAESEADRLIRLINDLLDIRRIEEGKFVLKLSEVTPQQLLDKAFDSVRNIAKEAGVELVSDVNAHNQLLCDEDRIIQVLTNLLSNAIKFSPANTKVSAGVEQIGERCRFAIVDSGCGILEEQVEKLFGRFEQLNSAQNGKKIGSGLGLFISKTIVEHHGGAIGIDSSYKEGSRFWFELPLERSI